MKTLTFTRASLWGIAAVAMALVAVASAALLARADTAPTLTTAILNSSNATTTSAQIGSSVHENVIVASTTSSGVPTGTVDFNLYNNMTCDGTPTTQAGVALVNGVANSSATTLTASGLSYKVHYSGDASTTPADASCQPLTATASSTTITTNLSNSNVFAGSSVNDTATINNDTTNSGGTVAYVVYTDNACSTALQGAGAKTVSSGVVPNSDSIVFNTPGTYYWQAVYSGDANNAAATSTCSSEVLTVNATSTPVSTPTISTTLSTSSIQAGSSAHDSAVLSGASATASGTVAYVVYTNNSCTTGALSAGTANVANTIVGNSATLPFNTAGTYYWQAVYSGDLNNHAATSSCGSEVLTVAATSSPVTPPTGGPGTISGTFFNDQNGNDTKDASDPRLSGWTVWLHKVATTTNKNGKVKKIKDLYNTPIVATATTDASGNYNFGNLAAGTYFVEEREKTGWNQTSDDTKVVLTGSTNSAVVNFANVEKNQNNNHNNDNDNDNNDDDASSTDNGNHNGFFNRFHDFFLQFNFGKHNGWGNDN